MIDTNNTLYPKDKPLGDAGNKANMEYYAGIVVKLKREMFVAKVQLNKQFGKCGVGGNT